MSLKNEIKDPNSTGLETVNEGSLSLYGISGQVDLKEYITVNQLHCLNQNIKNPIRNVLNDDELYLESDCDEQLIISIPFNQAVKLHSIKFVPVSNDTAPKNIKLYVNRPNIGFDETDSIAEIQSIELKNDDFQSNSITNLRFVKFQNVTDLTVSFIFL